MSDLTKKQLQQIWNQTAIGAKGLHIPRHQRNDNNKSRAKITESRGDAKDNREASNYKNKYARIQAIYDYINRKYNNDKYPNFFLVDGTKNSNMLIRGVPEETALSLDEMNNYLRGRRS